MNFASSLAEMRSWGAAGDAAGALAQTGLDELPFNFWIDGTATLHLHTDDGDDHWGKFALISVGGDICSTTGCWSAWRSMPTSWTI
jgi:hypothetical protein